MIELVELEKRHDDFAKRNTRVLAVSMESPADAAQSQADYPHLQLLADETAGLSQAAGLVQARARPDGGDAAMPTTILVDRTGIVRWIFRPGEVISRLTPDDVLQAVDEHVRTARRGR